MTPDICIYHANCMDGFTAVWVVKTRFPDVEMVPAGYGDMPPEVAGKRVLVVDFSYPLDVLVQMAKAAIEIVVLDHHKTAEQALARLEDSRIRAGDTLMPGRNLVAHFDMNKSGARLAWEYCYGDAAAPPLVAYTEDRDLWRWALPDTRIINAALGAYDQTLEEWSTLNTWLNDEQGGRPSLLLEGMAILRQREKDIEALIGTTKRQMVIGGHVVDVANAPFYLASDVANILGRDKLFAATYFDAPDGRIFSLRSPPDGMDVSIIAKTYGGGGHQHAAGFKMPRGWEGDGSAAVRVYPDEVSPQLHAVLRLMNFRTVPIAHALRAGGAPIPSKAEEEQAYVLHWMIKLAIDHPEDWDKRVGDRLQEIANAAKGPAGAVQ